MKLTTNVNGFKIITYKQSKRCFSVVYDAEGFVQFTSDHMLCAMQYANERKGNTK